ncbi:MAG: hypothetical protein AAF927_30245 [Bacteroidota bacterium]
MHTLVKSFFFLLWISFCFTACRPEPFDNEPIGLWEPIFSCGDYEVGSSGHHFDPFTAIGSFDKYIALVRRDTLYVKTGVRDLAVRKLALTVKDLISRENELLLAAEEGIYRVGATLEAEMLLDREVTSIALGPNEELLFVDDQASPFRVFALDLQTREVSAYTVPYETNFGAIPAELILTEEGSIWIRTQENNLIRYTSQESFFVYEGENAIESHLEGFTSVNLIDSPDGLLAWFKKEDQFVFLYQFFEGEWHKLYFSDLRMTNGLDATIRFAEPSNMLWLNRRLYLASDKGVIRFDLGEPRTPVLVYELIREPTFMWPSVASLHQKEPSLYYLINGGRQVEIDCR